MSPDEVFVRTFTPIVLGLFILAILIEARIRRGLEPMASFLVLLLVFYSADILEELLALENPNLGRAMFGLQLLVAAIMTFLATRSWWRGRHGRGASREDSL